MSNLVVRGKLYKKMDTEQIKETFRKREFILEYADNPQYPQYVKFELIQDRCEDLDAFQEGQEIEVTFDLRGREWTAQDGRVLYFTSLNAYRLAAVQTVPQTSGQEPSQPQPQPQTPPPQNQPQEPTQQAGGAADDEDDLPF